MPIVDAVLEEFEQSYHLLHYFPDLRSLVVEPVARIEEIQRVYTTKKYVKLRAN